MHSCFLPIVFALFQSLCVGIALLLQPETDYATSAGAVAATAAFQWAIVWSSIRRNPPMHSALWVYASRETPLVIFKIASMHIPGKNRFPCGSSAPVFFVFTCAFSVLFVWRLRSSLALFSDIQFLVPSRSRIMAEYRTTFWRSLLCRAILVLLPATLCGTNGWLGRAWACVVV